MSNSINNHDQHAIQQKQQQQIGGENNFSLLVKKHIDSLFLKAIIGICNITYATVATN